MNDSGRLTAQELRSNLRAECARTFRRSLNDRDVDQADISAATGASEAIVQRWADVGRPESIALVDVVGAARADRGVALDLIAWAADKLGLRVVERVGSRAADLFSALSASVGKSAEAHQQILASLADGETTETELIAIRDRARAGVEALAAIEHHAEAELARRRGPRATA